MSSKYPYPGLSVEGWTSASLTVADQLLSDFFLSEYSQTYQFTNSVSSFPWIIQQYKENLTELQSVLQNTLTNYFLKQFHEVEVEVLTEIVEGSINHIAIRFFMEFTDTTGERFNLSRMIKHDGMRIIEISNYLNGENNN